MNGDKQTAQELIETSREISNRLGLDRSLDLISSELRNITNALHQDDIFGPGGICSGYVVKALPNRYFIAQEFGKESSDLRKSVEKAFADFGVESIRADDQYWG